MTKFAHHPAGAPGYNTRNNEGWQYHGKAKRAPDHAPADIFYEPENDMEIFHSPEFLGNVKYFNTGTGFRV
jgi:hypothetical protein